MDRLLYTNLYFSELLTRERKAYGTKPVLRMLHVVMRTHYMTPIQENSQTTEKRLWVNIESIHDNIAQTPCTGLQRTS